MSFTEFSYPLLQAYDFLHLYDGHGCTVQLGGSDQWGNITAGIELVRKQRAAAVYGVTTPLVCDSAGRKFGKSEGNAVYLNADRTSPFAFYQFFVRTADVDVARFLKIFTFLPAEEIAALEKQVRAAPEARHAQKRLAEEVTRMVHSEAGLERARRATAALFGQAIEGLPAADLLDVFADVPSTELPRGKVTGIPVTDLAAAAGLTPSKSAARRLAQSGGLYLNNRRVSGGEARVGPEEVIDGRLLVLRSGKKSYHLVKVVPG
jgi:tyrosyl-tRNA synthetase